MFESTKTLPVMQRLPVRYSRAAQMVRSVQLRDSPGLGAAVLGFPFHQLSQFASQHGADTGSTLGRETARSLEKVLVQSQRDVLLHGCPWSHLTRKIRELPTWSPSTGRTPART